jgi:predicted alpha/beta hydrolase
LNNASVKSGARSYDLQPVEILAQDGFKLKGYRISPENPKAAVLICGATATSQRFYFGFARWLAKQGYSVLTFDYRGMAESLNVASAKDSQARKQDWGELDMPAALSFLSDLYPELPKHLIGHSAGGFLFGLMPNHRNLTSVIAIGSSNGYVQDMSMPFRLVALAMLKIYFPVAIKRFGYVPAKKLGWGEDLPKGVALQWADWCCNPGYVTNAFDKEIKTNYYQQLTMPILVLNMKDDAIATQKNVEAMQILFPKAALDKAWLDPHEHNLGAVGHMGFFRTKNQVLWTNVTKWLHNHDAVSKTG